MDNLISGCGCRFESDDSNSVLICEKCSELPCHNKGVKSVVKVDGLKELDEWAFEQCVKKGHQIAAIKNNAGVNIAWVNTTTHERCDFK